ncbi:hypothetical protein Nepgr_021102 [Nepenthes gracilis]|uniref:Uncharacterized protein n=1 Tax=Nepenthes gracilis TaxID=150966 RepID=A0AAD3XX12_NEPGR|nr:hypothetical protein Nepgr_021102 [Nepenthes gracilis]
MKLDDVTQMMMHYQMLLSVFIECLVRLIHGISYTLMQMDEMLHRPRRLICCAGVLLAELSWLDLGRDAYSQVSYCWGRISPCSPALNQGQKDESETAVHMVLLPPVPWWWFWPRTLLLDEKALHPISNQAMHHIQEALHDQLETSQGQQHALASYPGHQAIASSPSPSRST